MEFLQRNIQYKYILYSYITQNIHGKAAQSRTTLRSLIPSVISYRSICSYAAVVSAVSGYTPLSRSAGRVIEYLLRQERRIRKLRRQRPRYKEAV